MFRERVGKLAAALLRARPWEQRALVITRYAGLRRAGAPAPGLAVSGDIVAVQELLGHASLSTTRIYLDPDAGRMRLAVDGVA